MKAAVVVHVLHPVQILAARILPVVSSITWQIASVFQGIREIHMWVAQCPRPHPQANHPSKNLLTPASHFHVERIPFAKTIVALLNAPVRQVIRETLIIGVIEETTLAIQIRAEAILFALIETTMQVALVHKDLLEHHLIAGQNVR